MPPLSIRIQCYLKLLKESVDSLGNPSLKSTVVDGSKPEVTHPLFTSSENGGLHLVALKCMQVNFLQVLQIKTTLVHIDEITCPL